MITHILAVGVPVLIVIAHRLPLIALRAWRRNRQAERAHEVRP